MNKFKKFSFFYASIHLFTIGHLSAIAQIVPDQSLNTSITGANNSLVKVGGGRQAGKNLFHSFNQLNINTAQQLLFENSISTQNIFTRVTGTGISRLNGLISTLNPSNLYIFNSNGIIFGNSFQLNLGGSFLASTASSIQFNDGIAFPNVLTNGNQAISSTDLQLIRFSGNSGSISLDGTGNQLNVDPITRIGIGSGLSTNGIRVSQSKGIVLLGDGIQLNGGIATAPSGTIVLGSIKKGDVSFNGFQPTQPTALLDYTEVDTFSDISFKNAALLDASGPFGGFINLNGNNLTLEGSSYILIQNEQGPGGGLISLDFQDMITFKGVNNRPILPPFISPLRNSSGVYSSSVFSVGADIDLKSKNLNLIDAGVIFNHVALGGIGGNTSVDVSDSILVKGDVLPIPNIAFSSIFVGSNGDGAAGNIIVRGQDISLQNHGTIQSVTASSANSGSINVIADNSLALFGSSPVSGEGSTIESDSFRSGTAANISVKAKTLQVLDGAIVGSAALAFGDTGNVIIDITDSIRLSESAIGAIATADSLSNQAQFGLPPIPSGNVGETRISANSLIVENGSLISASNEGTGQTGTLSINVNRLQLNQSNILSFANGDSGGGIEVFSNFLQLDRGSSISVNSLGLGDGGNILINSDLIFLNSGSSIVANSVDFRGGNIDINSDLVVANDRSIISANANDQGGNVRINTVGFFLSSDSQVTATSQRGEQFDGNVDIDAEITDFSQDPDLNVQVDPPELYSACNDTYRDTLAYYHVGTAGRPTSPITRTPADGGWLEAAKARYDQRRLTYVDPQTGERKPLKRVVGWKTNANGTITFVNNPVEADQYAPAIAARQKACQQDQAKAS
ncbi:two-partner secretion domain-containing protein [Acaryochloris marina NIES-2412]|uniref:two-partner secretion domain-containing protein n=1 Tax=Acaryochloris marina TaxID=155978 RepID=UPI0040591F0B